MSNNPFTDPFTRYLAADYNALENKFIKMEQSFVINQQIRQRLIDEHRGMRLTISMLQDQLNFRTAQCERLQESYTAVLEAYYDRDRTLRTLPRSYFDSFETTVFEDDTTDDETSSIDLYSDETLI